jgi:hypothetical protein
MNVNASRMMMSLIQRSLNFVELDVDPMWSHARKMNVVLVGVPGRNPGQYPENLLEL